MRTSTNILNFLGLSQGKATGSEDQGGAGGNEDKSGATGIEDPSGCKGLEAPGAAKGPKIQRQRYSQGDYRQRQARGINELEEEDVIRNQAGMAKALNRTNVTRTGWDQLKI